MAVRGFPRRFRFPWRTLFDIHRDVDDEIAFHFAMRVDELGRGGMDAAAAQQEALRQFGDLGTARRDLRKFDRRAENHRRRRMMWDEIKMDARSAWRALAKRPGFSAVAVLVLALGIGANTAMFSLANVLLLKPLAIERPSELVGVYNRDTVEADRYRTFSYPAFQDIEQRSDAFASLTAYTISTVGLSDGENTRRVMAGIVSADYFDTFGVPPARGRGFSAEEERPGAALPVAVASHKLWQRYGGGNDFLGSTIRVNGMTVTIVGIAAQGFTGSTALFSPELWFPLGLYQQVSAGPLTDARASLTQRDHYPLMLIGRLSPGLDVAGAMPGLERLAQQLEQENPKTREHQTLTIAPLSRLGISSSPRSDTMLVAPVVMLMLLSGVVLLIACLDLTNMFLARGESRRSEIAVRVALGGGRGRLIRQQLSEGFLLALLGGVGGLVMSFWLVRLLFVSIGAAMPLGVSFVVDPVPDLRVGAAALVFCVLSTLLFALVPAWRQTSGDVFDGLKDRSQGGSGPSRSGRRPTLRALLVVSQLALSMVLLTAAGLFVRGSFAAAQATPGFSLENSLLVELDTSLLGYDEARGRQIYQQTVERLGALPGVETVGMASLVPFGSISLSEAVRRSDATADVKPVDAVEYIVNDRYFDSLRLPVLAGRTFDLAETWDADGPPVVIVDQPLADALWPNENPIGQMLQRVTRPPMELPPPMEVIGVVPGVRHDFTDATPPAHVYLPFGQRFTPGMHLHVRLAGGGAATETAMLRAVRDEIRAVDARLPVLSLRTMLDHRDESLFMWLVRTGARVFAALGALALFLALVGVYGVKAFVTARRTREIGLRLALGASPGTVMRQMVREGLTQTLWGLGLGLLLAYGVARLIGSMLYEVEPGDPLVFGVAVAVLALSAMVASWIPVRRACRIEPTVALRDE